MHTDAAQTEIVIFSGRGQGSLLADAKLSAWLRAKGVQVVEADYADSSERVSHGDPALRFVWCVMRNRWFVIASYLEARVDRYRFVLMTDIRDAIVQADPFAHDSSGAASLRSGAMVFSGEGTGKVMTLRQSRKGAQRTIGCARDADAVEVRL